MNNILNELISDLLLLGEAAKKPVAREKQLRAGESPDYLGYFHRGGGYYSNISKSGAVTHKTDNGKMRVLTSTEKAMLMKKVGGEFSARNQEKKPSKTTARTPQPTSQKTKTVPSATRQKLTVAAPGGIQTLNSTTLANQVRDGIIAPGNDFSRYSEAVSIFVSKYIIDNPDASDKEIMSKLVKLDCNSKTLTTRVTATIPKRLKAAYTSAKGAFSGCGTKYSDAQNGARFMAMIAARQKANRMQLAIQRTGLRGVNVDAFSGDKQSRSAMKELILRSTKKFFSETGQELDKETVLEYIDGFGTSKFPADTALIGTDAAGNIILVGFSDKKDLSAVINNSTINKEIERVQEVVDKALADKKITNEQHRRLTSEINESSSEYKDVENELSKITSAPAVRLLKIAKNNPDDLRNFIKAAKTLSTGTNRAKYWDKRIGKFKKDANKQENLQWLRKAGWTGKLPVSDEMAMTAFAYKCQNIASTGGDLPKDDQEILFRLNIMDREHMVKTIGKIRKRSLNILKKMRMVLDKVKVDGIPLGTYIDGSRAWKGLHLDLSDYDGALVIVAEDIVVDHEALTQCLGGVSNLRSFIKNLTVDTREVTNKEYGVTTGANEEVFSITPTGDRIDVGVRSIRSKGGILGKLETTWKFSESFQKCLAFNTTIVQKKDK